MEGQTVSHYRILEKIGEGGMGEVYLAEDTSLDRKVALKFLPDYLQQDETAHKRFLREAKSAAAIEHPFICNIKEVAQTDDGQDFIVMEYVQGQTLKDRLEQGKLPIKEALQIGSEVAEALEEAHSNGVIHRDLKPSNIMVTPSGHAKVLDFGLAKRIIQEDGTEQEITSALTKEGATLGTLAYMSPEQLRGEPVDARTDIFSFGIVLYEILTGVHPFRRETQAATCNAIMSEAHSPVTEYVLDVPELLQHSVNKMLAKDPEERYQSVHEVKTDLKILSQERKESVTSSRVWVLLVAAACVLVLFLALWNLGVMQLQRPAAEPQVTGIYPLTEDEYMKSVYSLETDGQRVYYARGGQGVGRDIYQVSVLGGPTSPVWKGKGQHWNVLDISPSRTELLLWRMEDNSLWVLPLPAGPPRRLGELHTFFASWSPDGQQIAYTTGSDKELYVVKSDGTGSQKLYTAEAGTWVTCWSPDGSRIRFLVGNLADMVMSIWEVTRDGANPHRVIEGAGAGYWTPDGEYFLFHRIDTSAQKNDIWALRERSGLFGKTSSEPVKLTPTGLLDFSFSTMSPDGKKILAIGVRPKGELVRYDPASGHWPAYLTGRSAQWLDFSRDGEWIAYVDLAERSLWRCRSDGSQPQLLTGSEMPVMCPRWSPDGTRIAFLGYKATPYRENARLYLVSAEGGEPELLVEGADPNTLTWSPDGTRIVFDNTYKKMIEILDLKTRKTETISGFKHLSYPQWSPDGHYLVAVGGPQDELRLYDFETGEWRTLYGAGARYPEWSRRGEPFVYFRQREPRRVFRIRITDQKLEKVADLDFEMAGGWWATGWSGLAPDDSILALKTLSIQQIYALDFEAP